MANDRIEINLTGTTFTDEVHYDVGASAFALSALTEDTGHDFFTKEDLVIRTASGGGGTLLTDGVDYTLSEEDTSLTSRSTAAAATTKTVYHKITIDNATYQTGALYFSGKYIADANSAEDYNYLLNRPQPINTIINGGFNIWQRGTSFAAIANATYSADRFRYGKSGAVVHTVTKDSTVPDSNTNYSLKLDVTTADASLAAGDYCIITTRIEGFNFLKYVGKAATLQFWVRDTKTGKHAVFFKNSGQDRTYIAEYTIQAADTWEWKQIQITFDFSGGTWDYINGIGIDIGFVLATGSTYHTTAGAWQTGNYLGTSDTVNSVDNTANNFYLSNVSLELGSIATDYHEVDIAKEIDRCQRYYEKSYKLTDAPGTVTENGVIYCRSNGTSTNLANLIGQFRTKKRDTPSIQWYSRVTGTAARIRSESATSDFTVNSTTYESHGSTGYPVLAAAPTDAHLYTAHYTADSEL